MQIKDVIAVTGLIGMVMLERLLRTTNVDKLYLLIRSKRNESARKRLEDVFKDPVRKFFFNSFNLMPTSSKIYMTLFETKSLDFVWQKIQIIEGDCGISAFLQSIVSCCVKM